MVNEARIVSQLAVVSISVVLLAACDAPVVPKTNISDENATAAPQTSVYFGDTHLHTALSFDADSFGNRLGPDEAYRFTKGAKVTSSAGVDAQGNRLDAQLRRPLDFVVVADHSDGLGFFQMIHSDHPIIKENDQTRKWHEMINAGGQEAVAATIEMIGAFSQDKFPMQTNDPDLMWPIWKDIVANAEKYNDPGKFTAFVDRPGLRPKPAGFLLRTRH